MSVASFMTPQCGQTGHPATIPFSSHSRALFGIVKFGAGKVRHDSGSIDEADYNLLLRYYVKVIIPRQAAGNTVP